MNTQHQKVAVITGASQGIGAGLVDAYRKLGYAVVATSRTIAPADDADILTVQGDIADPATAERVIAAGVERFGRIDTLVNNAGVFVAKPFTDYTQDDYATATGVNVTGFFRITQLAVEHMLAQGLFGVVIWIRERGVVRAIARRRKVLVAELLGHFGNAASVRATPREPRSRLRTGPRRLMKILLRPPDSPRIAGKCQSG